MFPPTLVTLAMLHIQRTSAAVIVTGLGCLALVAFLLAEMQLPAAVAKVIASSGFLAVAIISGAPGTGYGRLVLAGLALSFLGDAFLIGESQPAFLAGLAAFLFAHVAYVAAFAVNGLDVRWMAGAALPVIGISLAVSSWLAPHIPPELVVAVRLYTAVISAMVVAAFGTRGRGGSLLILAGALLFFFSDLSVAALRLVEADFPTYVWGLPLYYAGQLCLALSVARSRSR